MEDTGRFVLWPVVIERVLKSPLLGVGIDDMATYVPDIRGVITTPHNSFLYFALTSGVVPFLFWLFFWVRAGWSCLSNKEWLGYRSFRLPFLIYIFIGSLLGDINNAPWVLLAFTVSAGPGLHQVGQRIRVMRAYAGRTAASLVNNPSRS